MNSIAILYNLKDTEKPNITLNSEVHINFWKLPIGRYKSIKPSYERFIDFGVMIEKNPERVKNLIFYLPFNVKKGDVSDLAKIITKDSELLCTLFNSDLSIQSVWNNRSYHYVSSPTNDRNDFWVYQLGEDNFKFIPCDGGKGTLLYIEIITDIPSLPKSPIKLDNSVENKSIVDTNPTCVQAEETGRDTITDSPVEKENPSFYIRFRIKCRSLENYNYIEKISNDFLQSAFSKVEIIDFRINDKREINNKVIEKLNKGNYFFSFSKIHLFFMCSSREEPLQTGRDTPDCRLLEAERWEKYLDQINNDKKRKMLAYHWSKKDKTKNKPFESYNLFLKIMFSSINWKTFSLYSIVIILLGTIGSWLSTILPRIPDIFNYIKAWIK